MLKENIISMELKPGAMVSENELAAQLGLSRTPVREALMDMAQYGLVDILPQRGSRISLIDYALVEEARFAREVLEVAILSIVCENVTEESLAQLRQNVRFQQLSQEPEMSGTFDMMELDNEFHRLLFHIAHKDNTVRMLEGMMVHFDRVRALSLSVVKDQKIISDHLAICDAIERRDVAAAQAVMTKHLSRVNVDEATIRAACPAAIVEGSWAEADITALTEDASIRAAAQQLASQGVKYAVVTLKDATGVVYYASQVPAAAASPASVTVDPARVAAIFREEGLIPVAKLAAFRDPAGARADHAMAIGYTGQAYLWLDNKASADGKPWLNPYADAAVQYIGDLIDELHTAGFEQVVLENVQFPASTSSKQDYGTTNGVSRADQLRADMAVWEQRFGSRVTLWYSYTLAEVADTSSTLGVPAAQLGVKNLVVRVPSASTMTAEERAALVQAQTEAGVEHVVVRDNAAGSYE